MINEKSRPKYFAYFLLIKAKSEMGASKKYKTGVSAKQEKENTFTSAKVVAKRLMNHGHLGLIIMTISLCLNLPITVYSTYSNKPI